MSIDELLVVTLADRPDLAGTMWDLGPQIWPAFMMEDPIGNLYYGRVADDLADTCLLLLDGGEVVARAFFIPFVWDGGELPDRGWDAVIERGVADHDAGRSPNAASALEIGIPPAHRGRGLSRVVLDAMLRAVRDRGLEDLFAPVRPSGKHLVPHQSMEDYLARTTDEGLPADPWVRVHVRAGGRILKVAPTSMRIGAAIAQWESWTGSSLDGDGSVIVDRALVPLEVDRTTDRAVYVEPNVWIHHDLRALPGPG